MTDNLSKLPIKPVLYLVFISGVSNILLEQSGFASPGGSLSLAVRTVFWGSAIAYFAMRVYQIVMRKKAVEGEPESDTGDAEK